jgi:hypothetical protein
MPAIVIPRNTSSEISRSRFAAPGATAGFSGAADSTGRRSNVLEAGISTVVAIGELLLLQTIARSPTGSKSFLAAVTT